MNSYLTALSVPVLKNDGTLIKFIGDASLHIHGAPIEDTDHACRAVQTALDSDRNLLSKEEQSSIDREMIVLQKTLNEETDSAVLRKAVDHAAKATDDFAQMRMNASIQKALSGKNVAEI